MSEERKLTETEETLAKIDKMYEIYKDDIPERFYNNFKILISIFGMLLTHDLSIEHESELITYAQYHINYFQNELNDLIKLLKENREDK